MAFFFFFLILLALVFSFVVMMVWLQNRAKEREAHYQNETLQKLADSQGGHAGAIEFLRERERVDMRRSRESIKLAGLIVTFAGAAVMVFLRALIENSAVYLCGLIPLMAGIALLLYAYVLAPRE